MRTKFGEKKPASCPPAFSLLGNQALFFSAKHIEDTVTTSLEVTKRRQLIVTRSLCRSHIPGDATDWAASDGYGLSDACFADDDIPVDDILAAITADPQVSQLLDSLAATPVSLSGEEASPL